MILFNSKLADWRLRCYKITFAHIVLLSPCLSACLSSICPFYVWCFCFFPSLAPFVCLCIFTPMFVWLETFVSVVCVCLCVVETVLPSTTSSLCSRPITGPPSVSVSPTSTLNSSFLSTTSCSGTVQWSLPLPLHLRLIQPHPPRHGTCLCSPTGTGTWGVD